MLFIFVLLSFCQETTAHMYYTNPILSGFYPDPSICRVGDDYYLVNSSFSFFPGLPIFHSKDLVNWVQIGNALDRVEQLNLKGLGMSEGIYAPTIRYHEGVFYIVCTVVGKIGNFIISTDNPSHSWSNPVALENVKGMDPDLFFDGDMAYVTSCAPPEDPLYNGHRTIVMYELNIEKLTTSEEGKVLVNGGTDIAKQPIWVEGPHLFKENNYYYLLCAEGGTSDNHSVVIFRSKSLFSKFESYKRNPILTQRNLDANRLKPVTNTGHADFVQTQNGEWWSVFLGCRPYNTTNDFNTGRETFMLPVSWDNDWPHILDDNRNVPLEVPIPNLPLSQDAALPLNGAFAYEENFVDKCLPPYFLHIRTPLELFYSFPIDDGVVIRLLPQTLDDKASPAFIGRRQQHISFEISVQVDFSPKNNNEEAGLAAFQNDERYFLLTKNDSAFVVKQGNKGVSKIVASVLVKQEPTCFLKISGSSSCYRFFYSFDNKKWNEIVAKADVRFLSTSLSGGFVGTVLGMYATSSHYESINSVHFKCFNYTGFDNY